MAYPATELPDWFVSQARKDLQAARETTVSTEAARMDDGLQHRREENEAMAPVATGKDETAEAAKKLLRFLYTGP